MAGLQSLFFFIIAIAILVAFHEFGHFWVARKTGVKVIRFSIGFGKVLFSRQKSRHDTEFVIAAIPVGGYVKMVDEREGDVSPEDLPYAFNRQPLWTRSVIVAAGPLANLLLAVILFWLILVIGETGIRPVIGKIEPGTLAAQAGFVERDEIISINQKPTPTWSVAFDELLSQALNGRHDLVVTVKTLDGDQQMRVLLLADADIQNPDTLHQRLGLRPWTPLIPPVIGKLVEHDVAEQAGLKSGDLIISADGIAIHDWQQWVNYVQGKPRANINLLIQRDGVQLPLLIVPRQETMESGQVVGKIGAGVSVAQNLIDDLKVDYAYSMVDALPLAFEKTGFYALATLKMMGNMFIGEASVKNLSGPISIAQYAGQSAEMGFTAFLRFLALVSISLGVLNLLPVPMLDGGHLLFYAVEAIKGSAVSDTVQLYFQKLGMLFLLFLMLIAMFMDLGRLFS